MRANNLYRAGNHRVESAVDEWLLDVFDGVPGGDCEAFANPDAYLSRKSVADVIRRLVTEPELGLRESIGIHHGEAR